jgi:hypothetical protein
MQNNQCQTAYIYINQKAIFSASFTTHHFILYNITYYYNILKRILKNILKKYRPCKSKGGKVIQIKTAMKPNAIILQKVRTESFFMLPPIILFSSHKFNE